MFSFRTFKNDNNSKVAESKEQRGKNITSQMAAFVHKSKNVESSLNLNNLLSNKYPISMFDLTK